MIYQQGEEAGRDVGAHAGCAYLGVDAAVHDRCGQLQHHREEGPVAVLHQHEKAAPLALVQPHLARGERGSSGGAADFKMHSWRMQD